MKKKRDRSSPDARSPMTRSEMMARIGPKNTKPEIIVRSGLHAAGFRFRLHRKDLPGRPDLVLPRYRVVIFCHGCFWHAHEGCRYFRQPTTRPDFWEPKLARNRERDAEAVDALTATGWRVLTIWECALRLGPAESLNLTGAWIHGSGSRAQISGHTGQVRLDGWP